MLRAARFIAGYRLQPVTELVAAVSAMHDRLEIVSAERIRDELDKLITVDAPGAGLWFAIDTGLADEFLPELPAMRLEQDPIHRHKDVLTHTIAVVENVRPRRARPDFDFRRTRLAALFHDVGKPQTRGYQQGQGRDVPPPRGGRRPHDPQAPPGAALLARRRRGRSPSWSRCTCASTRTRWAGPTRAVRRYVRDAGDLLAELNVLTRCDCTTRNERKAALLVAAHGRARGPHRRARANGGAGVDPAGARRNAGDGAARIGPGPAVGKALAFLLEIRLDEGLLGEDEIRRRLDQWRIDHEGC